MIINIKVKPNSKVNKISKIDENNYEAEISEPAEDNKANIKLVNLLARNLMFLLKRLG